MPRFTKKRIAIAGVVVVALAALVVVAMGRHEPVPQFRFLENHVPVVYEYADTSRVIYDFEADFDIIADAAAEELTAKGFGRLDSFPQPYEKWIGYSNGDSLWVEIYVAGAAHRTSQAHSVQVEIWVPRKPSFWQRLISTIQEGLGLSPPSAKAYRW